MSKRINKSNRQDKVKTTMDEFKQGKLKSSTGQIVTDRNQALAIALNQAGLSNKSLQKAEVLSRARVFKSQLEAEIRKEMNNDNNIAKDITRYFKDSSNPRIDEIQKSITEKYKIEKSEVVQHIMRVSKELIEKNRIGKDQISKKKINKSNEEVEEATIISDETLRQSVEYIYNHINIINKYDVPYLAGYSTDGKSVYIDKDCPRYLEKDGQKLDMFRPLATHEFIEKLMIDKINMPYELSHQIALRIERQVVGEEMWDDYNAVMEKYIAQALEDRIDNLPPDLDLTPYKDMEDYDKLAEMYKIKQADIPLVAKEFSIV